MKRQLPLSGQYELLRQSQMNSAAQVLPDDQGIAGLRERKRILLWRSLQHHRPPCRL